MGLGFGVRVGARVRVRVRVGARVSFSSHVPAAFQAEPRLLAPGAPA
jgi:hypothetical protein